jgi:hypothetical protein
MGGADQKHRSREIRMSRMMQAAALLAGLMLTAVSLAQAPAGAPAGATGLCKDGTYWTNPTKKGACHGHKGIQTWYATDTAATPAAPPPPAAAPPAAAPPPPPAATTPAAPPKTVAAPAKTSSYTPPANAAPGGGPGLVWVNSSSKVYHCPGDRWYGKTKNGGYMSEADAKAQGNRPDHGKTCQ